MDRSELDILREGWDFEAKKAAGRDGRGVVPASFWETYSAMANSQGGRVVLGVRERKDRSFEVHGIANPDRVERELWDLLQNRQKTSINLLEQKDVTREEIGGKTVLVVTVPRARREERPVFINDDLWAGTFIRVHEGDRKAERDRIRRMVDEAEIEARDRRVLPEFGMDDLDSGSLRAYRQMFKDTSPDHPRVALGDQDLLEQLGAWGRDRESGKEGLTAAGLLLLGTYSSISEAFPYYFVDYQERKANTETIEWIDRVVPDGRWSGNLFDFYHRTVRKLVADLKVPFKLDPDLVRRDDTHIHEALREALVNTIIHADYEGRASVLVIKRPNVFEFRNPGVLRLPLEQILRGGFSDCRNRALQAMFRAVGLGEQTGSGFSRILRAWREQHWAEPGLEEDVALECVTLRLSMTGLLGNGSHNSPQSSSRSAETSPQNSEDSPQNSEDSPQNFPQTGENDVLVAEVASSRWATTKQVRGAILSLCSGRYMSVADLASALGRSTKTVQQNYVKPLVAEGLLSPRHPDQPNHPAQAYRAVPPGDID